MWSSPKKISGAEAMSAASILACSQVRVKAMEALGAARVLDKGLAACRAMETGVTVPIGTMIKCMHPCMG